MQQHEMLETHGGQGLGRINLDFSRTPKTFVPTAALDACASYRDAVRLAWESRANQGMTQRLLGAACALYAPHVSDYLAKDAIDSKGNRRRDLPAEKIDEFERVVGNRAVSQYLMRKAMLTIMEEVIAARAA